MTNYRLNALRNTEENRERIIEQTREKMQNIRARQPKKTWKPAIITAIALLVCAFLATPYIQQAFLSENDFTVEKVVLNGVPYDSLITSTYIDATNEFIYNTAAGFYSFDVEQKKSRLLVDTAEAGRIFDYAVSKEWLVWAQPVNNESVIHVLNRTTNDIEIVDSSYFARIQIQGDSLIFMGHHDGQAMYYYTFDLNKFTHQAFHKLGGEGSNSQPALEGNRIVISERIQFGEQKHTMVTLYDFEKHAQLGEYIFPYEFAQNILLKDEKIYSELWNPDNNEPPVIGVIDLLTGQFEILETSVGVDAYATDGQYFAISVTKGESNTVQLFSLQQQELQRISKLPLIKERLVKPRFTDEGTLVVNGEGDDRAMYLIRFDESE